MLVSEVCRSATCRVALPRVGLLAGREVARRRAPSCGVPVGAVCVCVRVQDADMLYVVRCGVLYVVCACLVPRKRAPGWGEGHAMDVRPADCRERCVRAMQR